MSLLSVIIALALVGLVLYLINRFVPMEQTVKTILNWVVIVFLIIYLLKVIGVFSYMSDIRL